jgi:hypothetical protein
VEHGGSLPANLTELQPACLPSPAVARQHEDPLVVELAVLLCLATKVVPSAQDLESARARS